MPKPKCRCCSETAVDEVSLCPECGLPGPAVPDETVDALLTQEALARRQAVTYHFCESPTCPVAYYSDDGASIFTTDDLRVRVGEKETAPPRPLCYCFGHTYESVREEWQRTGRTTVVEQIEAAMRREGCRCRTANPRGSCCLPQVRRFVAALGTESV
jgi:hypothetical protein